MNYPTSFDSIEALLSTKYHSLITTDILLKDGQQSQIITLLTHGNMFEETVMGINRALRSGGKATQWQSRVYSLRKGLSARPIVFPPHII